jgi:hypothetical protein
MFSLCVLTFDFSLLVLSRMFIINSCISFHHEGTVSYLLGAYAYCGVDFYLSERVASSGSVCGVVVFGSVSHRRSFAFDTTVVHVEQALGRSSEEITRVSLLGDSYTSLTYKKWFLLNKERIKWC